VAAVVTSPVPRSSAIARLTIVSVIKIGRG
jgi:hypothetical protein